MVPKSIKLLFVLILWGTASLHSIIILTHGFAAGAENTSFNTMWFEEKGDFFKALQRAGLEQGHDTTFFEWDQSTCLGFLRNEHVEAGKGLVQFIIDFFKTHKPDAKFPNNHEVILVGHSFGGLVCYHASQFLAKHVSSLLSPSLLEKWFGRASVPDPAPRPRLPHISKIFTIATPYSPRTEVAPNYNEVDVVYNLFSFADPVANNPLIGGVVLVPPCFFPTAEKIKCIELKHADGSGFGHFADQYTPIAARLFEIGTFADARNSHADGSVCNCKAPHPYITYTLPE